MPGRHLDLVEAGPIAGGLALKDQGTRMRGEVVEVGREGNFVILVRRCLIRGAFDLGGVEDEGRAGDETGSLGLRVRRLREVLVEEDGGAFLSLADLRTECLPLMVGGPTAGREALALLGDPEAESVDAVVALSRKRVPGQAAAVPMPGTGPWPRVGLELHYDRIGDPTMKAINRRRDSGVGGLVGACALSVAGRKRCAADRWDRGGFGWGAHGLIVSSPAGCGGMRKLRSGRRDLAGCGAERAPSTGAVQGVG